jgi:ABC-type Mn2+/Zn2+ transport system ATPase subunit
MSDVLIKLHEVSIGYERPLIHPISFELKRGEFWGIVGPNGAGKTSFARTILGLLKPLGGRVEVVGKRPRFSYTPQRHRLSSSYPLSTYEVVMMGRAAYLPLGRRPGPEDRRRVAEELARFKIGSLAGERFSALSGGQQQRALLARALSVDPDVLVLDEPAEGMDLPATGDILGFLSALNLDGRMAILMISHRLDDVVAATGHLCFINQYSDTFEAGPTAAMVSSENLSRLYGRSITTHQCDGKTHVHVGEG